MYEWSSRPAKTLRRVGCARWVDPLAVAAVEPTSAGKARVHLTGGSSIDVPIPDGEGIEDFTTRLLKDILADPTRRDQEDHQ